MVVIPKTRKTYCSKCLTHTVHKISQYKKGKESKQAQGRRRYDRKQSGYGVKQNPFLEKKLKPQRRLL